MAQHQARLKPDRVDPVWERIRHEAEAVTRTEPELATFIYSSILHHDALETAVVHRIAQRLDRADVSGELIRQAYADALEDDPAIAQAFRADIVATVDRDPATHRYLEPVLYFKGFHAIQTYRLAHWLWRRNRKDLAYYLQSRSSAAFQTDIHPAARIGRGIFLDHATGLVVGETAIIEVGCCARIAAGSVVLQAVPPQKTVAGVPAKVIGEAGCPEPARFMDQIFEDL